MTIYFKAVSVSLMMLMLLIILPFTVQAQTTTSEDSAEVSVEYVLEESSQLLDEIEGLEGVEVEEPTKIPSAFGFWWRNVKETVSLAVTRDEVKKAEKHIRFAEGRARLAAYIVENSDDEKMQERAQHMLEKADEYIQKVEEKKSKMLEKADERSERVLQNLLKHQVNKERVFDKVEDRLSPERLEKFQEFRDKAEVRHEKFFEDLEGDEKASEDVRRSALKAAGQVKEKRLDRMEIRDGQKVLLDRLLDSNETDSSKEQVRAVFEEMRKERNDAVRAVQEEFKVERQEILEAVKSGDEDAIKKLRELNKEKVEDRKEVQEKHREAFKKARKGITGDHDGGGDDDVPVEYED